MRAAPVVWVEADGISYAHIDFARVTMSHGRVVVVNIAEDGETARQTLTVPNGAAVLGIGPNASCTRMSASQIIEHGIRAVNTAQPSSSVTPLFDHAEDTYRQATIFGSPDRRLAAARVLLSDRFVDSQLIASAPIRTLLNVEADLLEESYTKFAARFSVKRFKRQPGGTDAVNRAMTAADDAVFAVAVAACDLLGLSTALGVMHLDGRFAFARELADAFRFDVTIPVGFLVGARKLSADATAAEVLEQIHHHMLVPRMLQLASKVIDV